MKSLFTFLTLLLKVGLYTSNPNNRTQLKASARLLSKKFDTWRLRRRKLTLLGNSFIVITVDDAMSLYTKLYGALCLLTFSCIGIAAGHYLMSNGLYIKGSLSTFGLVSAGIGSLGWTYFLEAPTKTTKRLLGLMLIGVIIAVIAIKWL